MSRFDQSHAFFAQVAAAHKPLSRVAALLDKAFAGHTTAELFSVMICCPLLMNLVQVSVYDRVTRSKQQIELLTVQCPKPTLLSLLLSPKRTNCVAEHERYLDAGPTTCPGVLRLWQAWIQDAVLKLKRHVAAPSPSSAEAAGVAEQLLPPTVPSLHPSRLKVARKLGVLSASTARL